MRIILFALFITLSAFGCNQKNSGKQKTESNKTQEKTEQLGTDRDFEAEGFFAGTMQDMTELDGCQFMINLEKGDKLNPIDLPEEYKVDAQKVWVKYVAKKGVMTTCMSGKAASIVAIEKR